MNDAHMEEYPEREQDLDQEANGVTSDTRPCDAIESVEDVIISVLSQLSTFGRPPRDLTDPGMMSSSEADDTRSLSRGCGNRARIELQLANRSKAGAAGSTVPRRMRYPKRSAVGSARQIAQLLRVLDVIHEARVNNMPTTKRDIYYRDVGLFKNQRTVDLLVDDVAATFQLDRSDLNIRATSKGLICGSGLVVHLHTGETIQIIDTEGTLIPAGEDIRAFCVDPDVAWILIVEKEAVFQLLCRLKFANNSSLPGRGLIITGKGYPDIATRHLIKTLADNLPPRIPFLALVDADPSGIDILSVYKFGSRSLQHENIKLATERIEWLGLWSAELKRFGVDRESLLTITRHDEAKALSILRRPPARLPLNWKKELMRMLHSRRKAEIEVLSAVEQENHLLDSSRSQDFSSVNYNLTAHHQNSIPHSSSSDTNAFNMSSTLEAPSPLPSPLTSPASSALPPLAPASLTSSHALLARYLVCKVNEFVASAGSRAKPVECPT